MQLPDIHYAQFMNSSDRRKNEEMFPSLPYDLLLNIASYLDLRDVHALHLTCKSLNDFSTTRPVYRHLANELLRRCRALPLKGFQRLPDLTTEQLRRSVNRASRYEFAWQFRAPRPRRIGVYEDASSSVKTYPLKESWYKIVSAPPGEEVDWLSPITSSYTLCATKSGKVVCWDVQSDCSLAEWNPGARWELWKCRVEFEERTVFFTMARVISGSYDDGRIMEFILMKLSFPPDITTTHRPVFSHVSAFKTTGVVMNVFLLDPAARLLSAFVWLDATKTIGLYVLLDWDLVNYVFVDTGIQCVPSSNWSCILYEQNIVIHCEESDAAYQHFYPLAILESCARQLIPRHSAPLLSMCLPPYATITRNFAFPIIPEPDRTSDIARIFDTDDLATYPVTQIPSDASSTSSSSTGVLPTLHSTLASPSHTNTTTVSEISSSTPNNNPFPLPPWYPESAHFVRQWWPSLPGIPRVSCTVVLLASHDTETHKTKFVLAQHYFKVPMSQPDWLYSLPHRGDLVKMVGHSSPITSVRTSPTEFQSVRNVDMQTYTPAFDSNSFKPKNASEKDDSLMQLWYVSDPFEVVCVLDGSDDEDDDEAIGGRPRPLVAVDFGHAVWVEYDDTEEDEKWLKFVTFPSYTGDDNEMANTVMIGEVRKLEIPAELDLDSVETINIDQSQGAVILSVKEGKIFILCYE